MASPKVLVSLENDTADRCVDLFLRDDGTFGFEEYRRDAEDMGRWTLTGHYGRQVFRTKDDALAAARARIAWLLD